MSRYMGLTMKMADAVSALHGETPETMHAMPLERVEYDRSEAWLDAQLEPFEIDPDEIRTVAAAKASYAEQVVQELIKHGHSNSLYQTLLSLVASAYREGLLVGLLYEAGLDPREVDVEPTDSLITDHEQVKPGGWVQSSTGQAVRVLGVDRGGRVVAERQLREPTEGDPGTSESRYHVDCFLREFVPADEVPFL